MYWAATGMPDVKKLEGGQELQCAKINHLALTPVDGVAGVIVRILPYGVITSGAPCAHRLCSANGGIGCGGEAACSGRGTATTPVSPSLHRTPCVGALVRPRAACALLGGEWLRSHIAVTGTRGGGMAGRLLGDALGADAGGLGT
mmetsp:Transcript_10782/g.29584  ORF Transcript_10782/g.29584 Transcript_10782/m.29584 type:complete len:145 (+) Transcript_10782:1387-1821(+)